MTITTSQSGAAPVAASGTGTDPEAAATIELRDYLSANNGIRGLEILEPNEIERAVRIFRRDGFVVIRDVLSDVELSTLKRGVDEITASIVALDPDGKGNRLSRRYSFGGSSTSRSMLHRPEWQMLLDLDVVHAVVAAIFESDDYMLRAASGDFCLPGATQYQPLHSDMRNFASKEASPVSSFHDPRGHLVVRDLPTPYVCVNFLVADSTPLNGPTRQIPGSQHSRAPIPSLSEEPEWMRLSTVCPAPAGAIQIRDVRAWHGGTPNLSEHIRSIPNLEFYASWFREPVVAGISHQDWEKLSERSRRLTRLTVADSSAEFTPTLALKVPV